MNLSVARRRIMAGVMGVCMSGMAGVALAQTAPPPPPQPVTIVGNTQSTLLYQDVVMMPGDKLDRDMDVDGFARASVLAEATSDAAATGRVGVGVVFGPPAVPIDNRLILAFKGGTEARMGVTHPVMGPRLHVNLVNNTNQPVTVNVSVYVVK
jgi:hypothetical protein